MKAGLTVRLFFSCRCWPHRRGRLHGSARPGSGTPYPTQNMTMSCAMMTRRNIQRGYTVA